MNLGQFSLTLSCGRSVSYTNKPIDLQLKAMDWFIYDRNVRHERVNSLIPCKKSSFYIHDS